MNGTRARGEQSGARMGMVIGLGLVWIVACALDAGEVQRKPNIVIILADDLGYADVGYHGCKDIPTPHIDSIARNGVWFTAGYATAPVCAPSRSGLLTGRYQNRYGAEDNIGPYRRTPNGEAGTPAAQRNMAERLKALGYATGVVGKWHDGEEEKFWPTKRGFDEFFGFNNGAAPYFIGGNEKRMLCRGVIPVEREEEYLTDAFGREAVAFIERHRDGPFLLYLAFNAVHGPLQAPETYLSKFAEIKDGKRRRMAAMHHAMDLNIGKVLEALKRHGLTEQTLLFFYSDNGGAPANNASRNDPLRGGKGTLYEGGIRIPFCAQWVGQIPAGRKLEAPVIALDILPTAIAAAGGAIGDDWQLDGVNLLPYMAGEVERPDRPLLFWRFNRQWAVRDAEWKLVQVNKNKPMLFNILRDIGETRDLSDANPEIAQRLTKAYEEWNARNIEPQWGWQPDIAGKYKVEMKNADGQ